MNIHTAWRSLLLIWKYFELKVLLLCSRLLHLCRCGSLLLQEQVINRVHRRMVKCTLNVAGLCPDAFQLDYSELTVVVDMSYWPPISWEILGGHNLLNVCRGVGWSMYSFSFYLFFVTIEVNFFTFLLPLLSLFAWIVYNSVLTHSVLSFPDGS